MIDEDLGHSASGVVDRAGFQRLVSEVGLDHVGLVLGLEMSCLARSGREWRQLLELCGLSRAPLADPDGVYDPAEHNDRMPVGLKGTISEAELHLMSAYFSVCTAKYRVVCTAVAPVRWPASVP
ncbi:recombinase family protein [Streptomyces sp. NBC_00268]|uniref:recombinase family protein n=1 Tax=Streptomyces sp. NBC_00268 TaxID=2975695 RepID=UPI00225A03CF|nr:recombinase family protein [Streptomyces sp. NBC_00268]MCX5182943.1 recombinase family protein [Streptomyces sp. NBC_00268]